MHGIAEELGVDVQTVRRWIQSGKLRAFKPGKEYRVRETDLEEFLAAREVRPKGPAPSPLEPSFNDVLEEERRPAHDVAVDAARRQAVEDRQRTARAVESERPQRGFMNHDNEAVMRLLQYPPDELAGALVELARHCVYLETLLEHKSEATPEKAATRDAPA